MNDTQKIEIIDYIESQRKLTSFSFEVGQTITEVEITAAICIGSAFFTDVANEVLKRNLHYIIQSRDNKPLIVIY